MKIHHLGIVVTELEESLRAIGLDRSNIRETIYDDQQNNYLHFIYLPDNHLWIELIEPVNNHSTVWNFARRHEMALHHIGLESEDLSKSEGIYRQLSGCFKLGSYRLSVSSFGGKISTLFIAAKGLIVEFVNNDKK